MSDDMFSWEEEEYYYLHKVEVHLALAAVNSAQPSLTRFVLTNHNPPSLPFRRLRRNHTSTETAKKLFKDLTGIDAGPWFIIRQIGVFHRTEDGTLIILYALLMPDLVPFTDESVRWVDFETLSKHDVLLKMMGHACNYYKTGG